MTPETATILAGPAADGPESSELTGIAGWVISVVESMGAIGVGLLVFLENLFPPIPSEVILPLAGYLAGRGQLSVVAVAVAATFGSVVGALVLYGLGAWVGYPRLRSWFQRIPLLEERDLDRAADWFDRHGGRAVLIGRVIPVIRSLISIPAGVERMPLPRFLLYTTLGSGAWNTLFVVLGYQLGSRWTQIGKYSDIINGVVIAAILGAVGAFAIKRIRRNRRLRAHHG